MRDYVIFSQFLQISEEDKSDNILLCRSDSCEGETRRERSVCFQRLGFPKWELWVNERLCPLVHSVENMKVKGWFGKFWVILVKQIKAGQYISWKTQKLKKNMAEKS